MGDNEYLNGAMNPSPRGAGRGWLSRGQALLLSAAMLIASSTGRAQSPPTAARSHSTLNERLDEIPDELREWIPWVKAELGSETCAAIGGERRCSWPGVLQLEVDEQGGSFDLWVEMDQPGAQAIVGSVGAWPRAVRVDGEPWPVLRNGQQPLVWLESGRHEISGRLSWLKLPETLEVGADTAFVQLSVAGQEIPLVRRESGKLWLKGLFQQEEAEDESELVELDVFRRISDGLPLVIETRLVFQVSGKARQLVLPAPLLKDTLPLSVTSDLAIALEPTGELRVQLVPGRHEVSLFARKVHHEPRVANVEREAPWPSQEIWTFQAAPSLRSIELSGVAGIDASRTDLPEEWRSGGAYLAAGDSVLELKTTRRGQEQIPPNKLSFRRELWLDETAAAYTAVDNIEGAMHQNFRLEMTSGTLGSVSLSGHPQVITSQGEFLGVETRDATLRLRATSRLKRRGSLPAVGWNEDADQLQMTLHLPPGWDVLAARGVDVASSTWLSRWDLFDVFYVLVVSFSMLRLAGGWAGATALVALVLCHGEKGAPQALWLPLIAVVALLALIKKGPLVRWLKGAFYGLSLLLLITLVSFSVDQVLGALFPHLSSSRFSTTRNLETQIAPPAPGAALDRKDLAEDEEGALAEETLQRTQAQLRQGVGATSSSGGGSEYVAKLRKKGAWSNLPVQKQFKPDAIVQTGPGVPTATGRDVRLSWSGPVVQTHQLRLWLISPRVAQLLTGLRLLAVGVFSYLLFVLNRGAAGGSRSRRTTGASGAAGTAMIITCCQLIATPCAAEQPSDARLAQLKARLAQPEKCQPNCLSVSRMDLQLGDGQAQKELITRMEVHAGARSAYRLPGPAEVLARVRVQVDGKVAPAVRLHEDGAYYLRVEPGVHQVEMQASLRGDRVTLDVGLAPAFIEIEPGPWSVRGLDEHGQAPGKTLTLQRDVSSAAATSEAGAPKNSIAVEPYFRVSRSLSLSVTSTVTTTIERLSDDASPEVMRLALLPGERLISPGIVVDNGIAEVTFSRHEKQRQLSSNLVLPQKKGRFEIELVAPPSEQSSEQWKFECGVIYRCQTQGVVPSGHLEDGRSLLSFSPFPGEKLVIFGHEPPAAKGNTLTVHQATQTLSPGVRSSRGTLAFSLQSSRALVHTVQIPARAKLEGVTVNGLSQAVRVSDGKVRVALASGTSDVVVRWLEPVGLSTWLQSPSTSTLAPGVNFRTVVELPQKRWLLAAGGPAQGPALLFWGYLLLIVVAALLLPRLPFSPLSFPQWLLLGLGLTQIPVWLSVCVAGWFFAVGARRSWAGLGRAGSALGRHRMNLLQVVLVLYTLFFIGSLFGAVYDGLVTSPDMEVRGAGSSNTRLVWFVDRSAGMLPRAWVISAGIWVWRGFMLAWALWLSWSLLGWLRWAYTELNSGGFWVAAPRPVRRRPALSTDEQASSEQPSSNQAADDQGTAQEQGPKEQGPNEQGPKEQGPNEQGPKEQGPKDPGPKQP